MKVGSLFSGIGGIEIGLENTGGFETEWFVEVEPYAVAILRKHFPKAKIYGDITKIDFGELPRVDVLTGGFPCQDISNAGKRAGIEGSRSSLWKHYLRAISEIRPRYALIENVSALLNRGFDVVLCDLASVGYDAEWHCISAASIGAPHRRDRIFIIAQRVKDVAYSDKWRLEGASQEGWNSTDVEWESGIGSQENVANTNSSGVWGGNKEVQSKQEYNAETKRRGILQNGWWAVEPDVGRVAHGVPFRVDRIKCLGNAVVPKCAEVFAKAILQKERE